MPDTITAILSVVSSLLLAFAMADDAGYAKANGLCRARQYLETPFWRRLFTL